MERLLFAPRALPVLRPDVAEDPAAYTAWIGQEATQRPKPERGNPGGLTIVIPVVGEPPSELIATVQSLEGQSSPSWTLLVVVESAWRTTLTAMFTVSGLRRSSQRLRVLTSDAPIHVSQMFAMAVAASPGSNLALVFPGDIWSASAVAALTRGLEPMGVVYADEDQLTEGGTYVSPRLKPTYSPEFLLHASYIGRPMVMSSGVVSQLQVADIGVEAFEHDLALRATEVAARVVHVAQVLCHRTLETEAPSWSSAGVQHIVSALTRRGDLGTAEPSPHNGTFHIQRPLPTGASVSIIIPFRDEPGFLRSCVDSIDATDPEIARELLLMNNGSVQPETATLLEQLSQRESVRVLDDDRPFNWASLNNAAARQATGDILVFLNNDIEAKKDGWLRALCAQAARPEIGAVGARLLYPDHRLQHCGVVIGLGGAAGHLFVGLDENRPGYLNMAVTTRECAAVTGACLATRRAVFEALDGFDESLGVDLNDVDYCLRLQRNGLRVLFEAQAELVHYESPSRGTAGDVRDIVHFLDRWATTIAEGDPYLNQHLTRVDSSCALRDPGESDWWNHWRSNLSQSA